MSRAQPGTKPGIQPGGRGVGAAPRLLPLALLFLAQAVATGATTASTVLASLVMANLNQNDLTGLPSTLTTLGAGLSAGLFGALMLARTRRFGLVTAYLIGVVGAIAGFVGGWQGLVPLFLVGAAVVGASQGGFQQARYAVAGAVPERVRGAVLGALMLASVLGSALTTALSGRLSAWAARLGTTPEVSGWLLAAGFLGLGAVLTLLALRGERPAAPAAVTAARLRLSDPRVWPAALAVAVAQALMVTLMSLTPLRAHHLGMDHVQVAGLVTVHVAGMFGFGWLTGPLLDRLGVRFGLVVGTLLLLAAAVTAALSGAWLAPSMFLLGLGWNFCFVGGSKVLTSLPGVQGRVDALGYLLAAVGTLLGGFTVARSGFLPLSLTCALLALLPLVSAWALGRQRAARPA